MIVKINPHQVAGLIVQRIFENYRDTNNEDVKISPQLKESLTREIVVLIRLEDESE